MAKDWPHVHVEQGAAIDVLPRVLAKLTTPTLFFIDAHLGGLTVVAVPL